MKLQTKFGLGILIVFVILAGSIAVASFMWVNENTIREAEQRVKLYIQSSWEIYNNKLSRMQSALEILAQDQQTRALLQQQTDPALMQTVRANLEAVRKQQNVEALNLLDRTGTVVLRARAPYHNGDSLAADALVQQVIRTGQAGQGTVLLSREQLATEGEGLLDQCLQFGGEPQGMLLSAAVPVVVDGKLAGILQMGSLLNGSAEKVDRIRDTVFKNEEYNGKPLGTATIFMGDLRISTNVLNPQGGRAVGTRASKEVAEQVLQRGLPWNGRAWVVDTWYLSQYDPIKDPNGRVVGMLYVGELEQKYLDMRTQALTLFLVIVCAGMVLAFAVFFAITRSILGPVRKLSVATERLADGDLGYRVAAATDHAGADEVSHLAMSFDTMAAQLERQKNEIESDREELASLNRELRTINRNYMEMLGFVTHELKNPLASAILNVHTVKDGYVGELNETQKEALGAVAKSLQYFSEMIRNYLDLSRLEKGEFVVRTGRVRLSGDVVAPALGAMERELAQKKMTVDNCISSEIEFQADRDLLRIVYDNLISNAIKYGKEGGRIQLDAGVEDGQVISSVWNEGRGIPAGKMSLLFNKFSRLDTPEYAGKKGTGLGLYICKEIVDKHGGKIWVESQEGQWTRFVFSLPRSRSLEKE